jgi:hypothetical protein
MAESVTVVEADEPPFLSICTSISIPSMKEVVYTTTSSYPEKVGMHTDTVISTLTGHISLLKEELKLLKKAKE